MGGYFWGWVVGLGSDGEERGGRVVRRPRGEQSRAEQGGAGREYGDGREGGGEEESKVRTENAGWRWGDGMGRTADF